MKLFCLNIPLSITLALALSVPAGCFAQDMAFLDEWSFAPGSAETLSSEQTQSLLDLSQALSDLSRSYSTEEIFGVVKPQ